MWRVVCFLLFLGSSDAFSATTCDCAAPALTNSVAPGQTRDLAKTLDQISQKTAASPKSDPFDSFYGAAVTPATVPVWSGLDTRKNFDLKFKSADQTLGWESIVKVYNDYSASLQAKHFQDSLQLLAERTKQYTPEEKNFLLSLYGSALSNGYDTGGMLSEPTLEQLYQNLQSGGDQGGVCRDIHTYISEVAKSLGFQEAGTTSLLWNKTGNGNEAGAHVISLFKDPKTGEVLLQNYSQVFRVRASNYPQALEFAKAYFGPFSGVMFAETKPGRVHQYLPNTSQWMKDRMEGVLTLKNDQEVYGLMSAGSDNQSDFLMRMGNVRLIHSQANDYTFSAIGYGSSSEEVRSAKNGSRTGLRDRFLIGLSNVDAPGVTSATGVMSRQSMFLTTGLDAFYCPKQKNKDRKFQWEGGMQATILDFRGADIGSTQVNATPPHQEMYLGASLTAPGARYGVRRVLELVPNTMTSVSGLKAIRADRRDELDMRLELHDGKTVIPAKIVVFGGLDQPQAVAGKIGIEVQKKALTFGASASKTLVNPSRDPFYEQARAIVRAYAMASREWKQKDGSSVQGTMGLRYSKGGSELPVFRKSGEVGPGLGESGGISFFGTLTYKH